MSAPSVVVLGRRVRPLERVGVIGDLLGFGSRATSYRQAEREAWPMAGSYVIVPALLGQLGIPYEVDPGAEGGEDA